MIMHDAVSLLHTRKRAGPFPDPLLELTAVSLSLLQEPDAELQPLEDVLPPCMREERVPPPDAGFAAAGQPHCAAGVAGCAVGAVSCAEP